MEKRTKVLVHSKSTGCPIENVIKRSYKEKPLNLPFIAYVRRVSMGKDGKEEYTLTYTRNSGGGDYYLRNDFELFYEDMFSDVDFLL